MKLLRNLSLQRPLQLINRRVYIYCNSYLRNLLIFRADTSTSSFHGYGSTFIKSTLEKSLGPQETTVQDPRKELCDYLKSPLEHVSDPVKWWGVSKPVSFYAGLTTHSSTISVNTLRYPRWLVTILLFKARRLHPRGPFRVQQFQMTFGVTRQRARPIF